MTPAYRGSSQIEVIVEFPVQDDPNATVLVGHGLRPARQVDDTEPPMPERHRPAARQVEPRTIGTPVAQPVGQGFDQQPHVISRVTTECPSNATHQASALWSLDPRIAIVAN